MPSPLYYETGEFGNGQNRELAMLIREFITTGRKLYAQCGNHFTSYRNEVDLSGLPLDLDHTELQGRVTCSLCGSKEVLLLPQTTRQMRQGRER